MSLPPILIVDDNEMNLLILEEILGDDYALRRAGNGVEAVASVAEHGHRLVFLDIMMPEMDGYEACRRIKALPAGDRTHVILVSAKASAAERLAGYAAGADDYVVKPFEPEELLAKARVQWRLIVALSQLDAARAELAADNDQLVARVDSQSRELLDARDLTVFALANLADSRDPETGAHLDRIRRYCRLLAMHLAAEGPHAARIDDVFIERIYQASPLHDIGKVGIPDAVLLKPGRLSDHEFELMKRHSTIGAAALRNVAGRGRGGDFLDMAIEIAESHHERWDGTGYPHQIAGEAIPLCARIAAVADVFDALTSVRVYKDAFSLEVARAMILADRGTHFDPAVVDAFEACFPALIAARDRACSSGGSGDRFAPDEEAEPLPTKRAA